MRPRHLVAALVVIGLTATLVVARPIRRRLSPRPSRDQCTTLVERRAEQLARAANPKLSASAVAAERASARSHVDAVTRCMSEITREEAECALASYGPDEFERCLGP